MSLDLIFWISIEQFLIGFSPVGVLLHKNLVAIEYFKTDSDYQVFLQSSSVKTLFLLAVCTEEEAKKAWERLLFLLEHNSLWWAAANCFKERAVKATDPNK